VRVAVAGHGWVTGDIAWGGNWFFLVAAHDQVLHRERAAQLTAFSWRIRQARARHRGGRRADRPQRTVRAGDRPVHSRNFVLCLGKLYDRSPCGTGTSAKLACQAADGALGPGET
jgi:4-hydroxyproline epimerase